MTEYNITEISFHAINHPVVTASGIILPITNADFVDLSIPGSVPIFTFVAVTNISERHAMKRYATDGDHFFILNNEMYEPIEVDIVMKKAFDEKLKSYLN